MVQLDFADEASFAKAMEYCEKIDFTEEHVGRRLLGRQAVREIEEIFTENKDKAELRDERWKVAFFKSMTLE